MSSAPTDCRVPDPTDAKADGNFGNHRAGYGDRLDRIIATARKGWTLAAGEGLVLVQEIDRMQGAVDATLDHLSFLQDENKTLREERDAAEANAERRWDDIIAAAKKIELLERILAALREPSEAVLLAARKHIVSMGVTTMRDTQDVIRAAVAAAEREVAGE
jgi:hypothetical protein